MKKYIFSMGIILSVVGYVIAAASYVQRLSKIGPATSTSQVTVAAPATGVRNCLTDIDITTNAGATIVVLTGGTTAYSIDVSSGGGVVRSWDDASAPCAAAATAMYVNVTAGNFRINYGGYTY